MIRARFLTDAGRLCGFSVSGHAGFADAGEDIVCAAVSSAIQLTANGITEILGLAASVEAQDDTISLRLAPNSQGEGSAEAFLKALRLQLSLLAEDYPQNVKVTCTEV